MNLAKKTFAIAVCAMALFGTLCALALLANSHLRFNFLEIFSHYASKIKGTQLVVVGDSIAAGGRHWAGEIGLFPLQTRNLGGNGYTIFQIAGQIADAKTYKPEWLVVFGGTNDAFQLREGRISLEQIRGDLEKLLDAAAPVPVVYVLPPPTEYADVTATLETVRGEIVDVLKERGVPFVDSVQLLGNEQGLLKKEYSSDGVHLKAAAYDLLGGKIQEIIFVQK
jgi:lysophospholipase L1-like esterase